MHNAIFFQYRSDFDYNWNVVGENCYVDLAKLKHWIKPLTVSYFEKLWGDDSFMNYNKLWGGLCVIKKTKDAMSLINEWLRISLFYPELVIDPSSSEKENLPGYFIAHRHDQTIITPLVYHYAKRYNLLVLPETSESDKGNAWISAIRNRLGEMSIWARIKYRIYYMLKS
jgi:hypothetical protein